MGDDIKPFARQVLYRINVRYGNCGVVYGGSRGLQANYEEEVEPIHPVAHDKRIVVVLINKTLSWL